MGVTVKVTSDFVCPWCLIGERRLVRAIGALAGEIAVTVEWLPFELNPAMPAEGMDRPTYRALKFGSVERGRMLDARTIEAAQGDGIAFAYDRILRTPNTFRAHRLMRLAARQGVATPLAGALFAAYFEQGRDIGDAQVLADIAAEHGLDRAEAAAFLSGDDGAQEVRAIERAQQAAGVDGVPFFDISGLALAGAQPVQVLVAALRQAAG
ncbi:DsbA family oxidoreductase [Xanthobacter sp. KR7-225]|uniref:DsbA family oxidoreductase n=1 Tax=Xanthobacter sp. KR7-225 TaxID=3156613 RepID=UPI0032B3EED7